MTVSISEFYAGKHVFLTGGTGFIGKVLIEKLLRSCPDIACIYCLIRPKKGQDAHYRLHEMFKEPIYEKLHRDQPSFEEKVRAVSGDIMEAGLGMRSDDVALLLDKVNIVFHSAATIRFNEALKLAVEMNLVGVRKMVELCRQMTKLEVLVHISTAYANCDLESIEEIVYPPPADPQKLIDALSWMDDDLVATVTPKLIGKKPNTYTYTKHLAESLLVTEGGDLPLAIVRPSIVTAAWKEPIPGWIDNKNGPSSVFLSAGKGVLRSLLCDGRVVADILPVDLAVNLTVSVAWHTAVNKPAQNATIYHMTTGNLNPCTWGEIETHIMKYFKKYPMEACFRRPNNKILTENSYLHDFFLFFSHMLPAYTADLGYLLIGKKPRMVRTYKKLHKGMEVIEFFTMRSWEWTHDHMDMLRAAMSSDDVKKFYFDPRPIHWPSYVVNYCRGTQLYILKEEESGLPAARAHLRMLRNIRYAFNSVLLVILWRLLIARSSLARNSWYFVMGLAFKFVRFFRITSTI